MACSTVSCNRVSVECEAYRECFHASNEAMVKQLAKAGLGACTDDELREEAAEATVKVPSLMFSMTSADKL